MTGADDGRSSFSDFLARTAPDLLPAARARGESGPIAPHGTTIVAVSFPGGVVIAGDRRATSGNLIASRDIRKVFITDDHTAVGIAGTAGIAIEMVRLFTVELEHYEKIEGVALTFDGKSSRLAEMVRANLGAAMQGLIALPLLVGVDPARPAEPGRIVSFDATGGRYAERRYHAIGSGSVFAKSSLKKIVDGVTDTGTAVDAAIAALYDAADDDSATGGPDVPRGLYPIAVAVTAAGAHEVDEADVAARAKALIAARTVESAGGA